MSNVPKNKTNAAVLYRDGAPDYITLSTESFPTPQADEGGAILEHSNTGNRFRWSSTAWIQIETSGAIIISDFFLELSKGNIIGHSTKNVLGSNPAVGTSVEDLWDLGGVLVYPTSGEQWELVSDDAADTSAGTGARTVKVSYLDDSYVRQSETITMNGVTAVATVATDMFRFEELEVITAGSGAENAGIITLRVVSAGANRGGMLANQNTSFDAHYTVPAGKTTYILSVNEEINKGEDVVIRFLSTRGANGIFRRLLRSAIYQNNYNLPILVMQDPFLEKTDLKITVVSSNAIASPSVILQMIEVDN